MNRREMLKMTLLTAAVGTAVSHGFVGKTAQAAAKEAFNVPTRRLGKSDLNVSALGFGCMGMSHHRGVHPDKKQEIALLHQAVDIGVTLFDTAESYGPWTNEELVGEALRPYQHKVNITTKFGHTFVNGRHNVGVEDSRPENIRRVCEASLKRLGIDSIAVFYQHRFDVNVPIEDVAGTVRDLIKEGKVRNFGLCEVDEDIIRRAHKEQPVAVLQSEYHLMHRSVEKLFPVLEELGIGFVPYSPLNRGFLGGDLTEYTNFDNGNDNRFGRPQFMPEAIRNNLKVVACINEFGRPYGMTGAQVALAWMLAKRKWIVPIPGTVKYAHLAENMGAANFNVEEKEWRKLEKQIDAIKIVGDRYSEREKKLMNIK